jgi:hypothetical protein
MSYICGSCEQTCAEPQFSTRREWDDCWGAGQVYSCDIGHCPACGSDELYVHDEPATVEEE